MTIRIRPVGFAMALSVALLVATAAPASADLGAPVELVPGEPYYPLQINDEGVIAGSHFRDPPPIENCNPMCERARQGGMYGLFIKRPNQAPEELLVNRFKIVALNDEWLLYQVLPAGPTVPPPSTPFNLRTGRSASAPRANGRGCLALDIDRRGQLLCELTDGTGLEVPDPILRYLGDTQSQAVTRIGCGALIGCSPLALNDSGVMAGLSGHHTGPIVWEGDKVTALESDPSHIEYEIIDVNETGTVLGRAVDEQGTPWVVWWRVSDRQLHVAGSGSASALNDSDIAVGYKKVRDAVGSGAARIPELRRAYLWDLRRGLEIALAGQSADESVSGQAHDINNHGVVVGQIGNRGVLYGTYP